MESQQWTTHSTDTVSRTIHMASSIVMAMVQLISIRTTTTLFYSRATTSCTSEMTVAMVELGHLHTPQLRVVTDMIGCSRLKITEIGDT